MLRFLSYLTTCLVIVRARDMGKTLRTMPFVTNSLVNLGKMDISFYLNARPEGDFPTKAELTNSGISSIFGPKSKTLNTEPCPCSSFKYMTDSTQNHPSELLNKILLGNDFFSYKNQDSSTLCCDSHEHMQEDILLEFGPKQTQILTNSQNPFPLLPFILENLQKKPTLPKMPAKKKAVEIFFFPKNKQSTGVNKLFSKTNNLSKKENIKIVGDKEIKNEFKSKKFVPPISSSVKKDLVVQNTSKSVTDKAEKADFTVDNKSNTV